MKLAILTTSFPYYPGEQFIESEVSYWETGQFTDVFILPSVVDGQPRAIPQKFKVDFSLCQLSKAGRLRCMLQALFTGLFLKELVYLWKVQNVRLYTVFRALKHVSIILQVAENLGAFAERHGGIDVVYSYWHEIHAYAAVLVKQKGLIGKVVARAHRVDLYEEYKPFAYMPLKRQFINCFDQIYVLSYEAKSYLQSRYAANPSLVFISPLGVSVPELISMPSPEGFLHIASVSFCVPVKQIDKIIQALVIFADKNRHIQMRWSHIGDGPLFEELKVLAEQAFAPFPHMTFEFKGNLANIEVNKFYLQEPVDLFINASKSEGMPVSIMEAMSVGVPAIAPDVGGIAGLIGNSEGILMSQAPSVEEIAKSIETLALIAKTPQIRAKVRQKITEKFNASSNYSQFVSGLCELAKAPS